MSSALYETVRIAGICAALLIGVTSAQAQLDPKNLHQSWKQNLSDFKSIMAESGPDTTTRLRSKMDKLFDYTAMGDRTLASVQTEWNALPEADRARFRSAFKQLVQQYFQEYLESCIATGTLTEDAADKTTWRTSDDRCTGAADDKTFVVKLKVTGNTVLVADMVVDEISVVLSYKSQITKIVRNDGFDAVIQKIKKRSPSPD